MCSARKFQLQGCQQPRWARFVLYCSISFDQPERCFCHPKHRLKQRCTLVACGWWSTIAVVAEPESERGDQVYSWGANDSCQLGRGDTTTLDDRAVPARLMGFPERLRVASVACGWKHVLLVGGDGGVFSWGTGRHGQLGLGDDVLVADRPQRVAALDAAGIKRIRCGWEHSLFHAGTGEVYTCGSNRHGQLGIRSQTSAGASKKRQAVPVQVQIECNDQPATPLLAEQVDCGWHFALCILSRSEELVSWGKGSHGQLALGSFENQHLPSIIDFQHRVQQIACGSEHVLVVANGGELYSCGWGEHGNLGTNARHHRRARYLFQQCSDGAVIDNRTWRSDKPVESQSHRVLC